MKKLLLFINRNNTYITNIDGALGEMLKLLKKLNINGNFTSTIINKNSIDFTYNNIEATTNTSASGVNVPAIMSNDKITLTIIKKIGYYTILGNFDNTPNYLGAFGVVNFSNVSTSSFKIIDFDKYDWKTIRQYFIEFADVKQKFMYENYKYKIKNEYNLLRDDKFEEMFQILENDNDNDINDNDNDNDI